MNESHAVPVSFHGQQVSDLDMYIIDTDTQMTKHEIHSTPFWILPTLPHSYTATVMVGWWHSQNRLVATARNLESGRITVYESGQTLPNQPSEYLPILSTQRIQLQVYRWGGMHAALLIMNIGNKISPVITTTVILQIRKIQNDAAVMTQQRNWLGLYKGWNLQ